MTGIIYNEETGRYELWIDGEWIFEGSEEQCYNMYYNSFE